MSENKPADRNNTASRRCLINEKLRFDRYNKIGGVGARVSCRFHAVSQKLRSARGFCNVVRKFCNTHFGHYITALFQKFPLRVVNRGAILIEFAVCMPILIILLFYIYDLVRIKRYYSQTEFVAYQMANMIQNISKKRSSIDSSKKVITQEDLKRIICAANLSIYPGTSMFTQDKNYFGHVMWVQMYRVVGAGNGQAKCTDRIELSTWHGLGSTPTEIWFSRSQNNHDGSKIRYSSTAVAPNQICPRLKINSGDNSSDEKIILETCLLTVTNLRPEGKSTDKEIFGFYLLNPPCSQYKTNIDFFINLMQFLLQTRDYSLETHHHLRTDKKVISQMIINALEITLSPIPLLIPR